MQHRGIDLKALGLASLCAAPLFLMLAAADLLSPPPLDRFLIVLALDLVHGLTPPFGITAITVAIGVLTQSKSDTFSTTAYWRAIFIFAGLLALPYLGYFIFTAMQRGLRAFASFGHRSNPLELVLALVLPLVTIFAGAWLYLRFRRDESEEKERRRFLFLLTVGVILSLPGFLNHLWLGIVSLTSPMSPEPGYADTWLVSWISTLIGSVFTGFGLAFLFGLPAIAILKRTNREGDLALCLPMMILAAFAIWVAAYGLALLSLTLTLGEPPDFDYWPTQEAVIAFPLLLIGGIGSGFLYHRRFHP